MPDMMPSAVPPLQDMPPVPARRRWPVFVGVAVVATGIAGAVWFFRGAMPTQPIVNNQPVSTATNTPQKKDPPTVDPYPDDLDRDGIANEEEKTLGLNEKDIDTDGDGITDYDEIRVWKTDPKNVDTDGDGYRDGVEIVSGNNPNGKGKMPRTP